MGAIVEPGSGVKLELSIGVDEMDRDLRGSDELVSRVAGLAKELCDGTETVPDVLNEEIT